MEFWRVARGSYKDDFPTHADALMHTRRPSGNRNEVIIHFREVLDPQPMSEQMKKDLEAVAICIREWGMDEEKQALDRIRAAMEGGE